MQKFKIGQKVITEVHDEDATIVDIEFDKEGNLIGYKAQIDRFKDVKNEMSGEQVGLFSYMEHELLPWEFRRFVRFGDHHMRLHDCSKSVNGEFAGIGTWGIKDVISDQVVMYVSSSSAYWIVKDLCRAMNEGTVLKKLMES